MSSARAVSRLEALAAFSSPLEQSFSRGAPGFVLVGVVIMVLALTMLGMSLFSLSSYEAQFLNRSVAEIQALQYAMGGLELARSRLASSNDSLARIGRSLPHEHVTYARGMQLKMVGSPPVATMDSFGPVAWGGNDIEVRVRSEYEGVSRTVEARFQPINGESYYKRLITCSGAVDVLAEDGSPLRNRLGTVRLTGAVWQNSADSSWKSRSAPYAGGIRVGGVPVPSAGSFIAAKLAGAQLVNINGGPDRYELWGTSGQLKYWTVNQVGKDFSMCPDDGEKWEISVRGRAVLLLPRGMHFDGSMAIRRHGGDPQACLVVVANRGSDPGVTDAAIWLRNSISRCDVPTVFVTDGAVILQHYDDHNDSSSPDQLAIFAGRVLLAGPRSTSGRIMDLDHPTTMDAVIDSLVARDALPNSAPAAFAQRRGSWRVER